MNKLLKIYYRLELGIDTPFDVLYKIYLLATTFSKKTRWKLYEEYLIKKIDTLPHIKNDKDYRESLIPTYYDIFFPLKYDRETLKKYEYCTPFEGTYCYENVTVNEGDIVIDAGAFVGAFSLYASSKALKVYAFEPSTENRKRLEVTVKDINVEIVPFALHNETKLISFSDDNITSKIGQGKEVQAVSLDDFVAERGIRVDFIKSDIEGNERNLLKGATNVLKTYAPKLAICTYHFPEDREVLTKIILEANPNYQIHYGKMKLYAWVDNLLAD